LPDKIHLDRRLVITCAIVCGVLLALAVQMLGQALDLDLTALWLGDPANISISVGAAWWMMAAAGFAGGYATTILAARAAAGRIPQMVWWILAGAFVLILAAAGQFASAPSTSAGSASVLAALAALTLGAAMAICGVYVAPKS
jgi:hypothetical protein